MNNGDPPQLTLTGTWEKVCNLPWLTFHWLKLVVRADITHLDWNKINLHSSKYLLTISEAFGTAVEYSSRFKNELCMAPKIPQSNTHTKDWLKGTGKSSSDLPLQIETMNQPTFIYQLQLVNRAA